MGLDIRLPIGLLFSIFGILLLAYGFAKPAEAQKSLGLNVNLEWGGVMLVFGAVMLLLGWRGHTAARRRPPDEVHEK
jgi:hypothetical protein